MKKEIIQSDFILVNDNEMRLVAMISALFSAVYLYTGSSIITILLAADFALRIFKSGTFSLSRIISNNVVDIFSIEAIPVNFAPHKFSAMIGFILSILITLLSFFGYIKIAVAPGLLLFIASLLESYYGYCAGCHIYNICNQYVSRENTVSEMSAD